MAYSEKMAREILVKIAGGDSLTKMCKENKDYPNISTVLRWRENEKHMIGDMTFYDAYIQARCDQADWYFDYMTEAAMSIEEDLTGNKTDNALIQARRLKLDAIKWAISKLKPGTYGEKLNLTQDTPLKIEIVSYADIIKPPEKKAA